MTGAAANALNGLVLLEDGRTWGDMADPHQRADAEAILDRSRSQRRHWVGRPRGYSKTADVAGMTVAKMVTGELPAGESAFVAAADQQQARILLNDIAGYVARSGLQTELEVQANRVVAIKTGTVLTILASDDASAFGLRPAWLVVDELCQFPETARAQRFLTALTTGLPKVAASTMVIITTSGDPAHWSHKVFEQAEADPARWRVSMIHTTAPWMDPAEIEAERRRLPDSDFARLFQNQWAASADRLFKPDDVHACATLAGPLDPDDHHRYVLGVDLALRNDSAVVAVGHAEGDVGQRTIVVDRLDVFTPSKGHDIDQAAVEACIRYRYRQYSSHLAVFDPAGAWQMMQSLNSTGVNAVEFTFTQTSNSRRVLTLLQLVREHRLAIPDDEELVDELIALRLVEKSPGVYKHEHDQNGGHDDRATAVSLIAVSLLDRPPPPPAACAIIIDSDSEPNPFGRVGGSRGGVTVIGRR